MITFSSVSAKGKAVISVCRLTEVSHVCLFTKMLKNQSVFIIGSKKLTGLDEFLQQDFSSNISFGFSEMSSRKSLDILMDRIYLLPSLSWNKEVSFKRYGIGTGLEFYSMQSSYI